MQQKMFDFFSNFKVVFPLKYNFGPEVLSYRLKLFSSPVTNERTNARQ